ncbi:hypothetical protein QUF70_04360 [Desulfobacterales bacterium HSG17]|nr:hypothetical protein [Desulfobacterales bacterium HSG17]
MLETLNKIREIAFDFDNYQQNKKILDYRIQLNNDLGISAYILTEHKGVTDYPACCSDKMIKIKEFTEDELAEDDFHKFVFDNKQKINLGYRERLRSLLEPDIENNFDADGKFPPIISFYSYKGGLGRTTTLAGFAIHCAYHLGMRVLIIDGDLEAPGVPAFYDIDADILAKTNGIVEYFLNRKFNENIDLSDYIIQLDKKYSGLGGDIFILPAGNLSDNFENEKYRVDDFEFNENHRLQQYNIHRTHYLEGLARLNISNPESIMLNFAAMLKDLINNPDYSPDLILIDSRTGFSEILGIFVLHISDIVAGFFRDELQAKPGLHFLFEKIVENKKKQELVLINSITSDRKRIKTFEENIKLLAEKFDTGEGPYSYYFASIDEDNRLKNLGGDSETEDAAFIEMITQKQFHSYDNLFKILEGCIENRKTDKNEFHNKIDSGQIIIESKKQILKDLYPFCKNIFSDKFDFNTTEKDFLKERFYYRNVMLNIFNPDKFLILAVKGTGKTLFYKALQSKYVVNKLKTMAKKSGEYYFINVIKNEQGEFQNFYPVDKFRKEQIKGESDIFFHRFWIIYLWKSVLLESKRLDISFSTDFELREFVRPSNPNDSGISLDFVKLINDDRLFTMIEKNLKDWDKSLNAGNQYLFATYDFLDNIVKPDFWETGYGIVPLLEFWRYNPYKRILPKLFIRTDLFKKISGITNYGSLEKSHSFNLEWQKEELFALLFKQVLAKSAHLFFNLMEYNKISQDIINEIKKIAEKNDNQIPLQFKYIHPMVRTFFGSRIGFQKRGGDSYTWFYINLRNADDTISIRPFLNMLSLAIKETENRLYDLRKYIEILPYQYYANAKVRSECVKAYFNDLAKNSEGNKPLECIFDFIKNENKIPVDLKRHTLTRSGLNRLLGLILEDKDYKDILQGQTDSKLKDLMISNGILKETPRPGGVILYNFAYLYKFYLGLKSNPKSSANIRK